MDRERTREEEQGRADAGAATRPSESARTAYRAAGAAAAARLAYGDSAPARVGGNVGGNVGGVGDAGTTTGDTPLAAPEAAAGLGGMVTQNIDGVKFSLEGKDSTGTLAAGTFVSVISRSDATLRVRAFSGHGGAICDLPVASFRAEPLLAHNIGQNTDKRMDDGSYLDARGPLWIGQPKVTDVNQGYLGDCYFIASMGSVAAANPHAIMNAFSPQTPGQASYNISLYKKTFGADGNATFVKQTYVVDSAIPVYTGGNRPHYAGQGGGSLSTTSGADPAQGTPLWPMLLEKAYAIHLGRTSDDSGAASGDYGLVGDNGGQARYAMEAIVGAEGGNDYMPSSDAEVLKQFESYQKNGEAVCCGTIDSQASGSLAMSGSGSGPYALSAKMGGEDADFVPSSVHVTDGGGQVGEVTDDGTKLVGGDLDAAASSINYSPGTLSVSFKGGKAPKKPADLTASASLRGLLDADVRVHAWHAYMFEKYDAATKLLYFKNPWGTDHPKPLTAAQFRKYFTGFDHIRVPAQPGRT